MVRMSTTASYTTFLDRSYGSGRLGLEASSLMYTTHLLSDAIVNCMNIWLLGMMALYNSVVGLDKGDMTDSKSKYSASVGSSCNIRVKLVHHWVPTVLQSFYFFKQYSRIENIPVAFADEVIYSLFAKQSEDLDLLHEDLEQIDVLLLDHTRDEIVLSREKSAEYNTVNADEVIEEQDLKWTLEVNRFPKLHYNIYTVEQENDIIMSNRICANEQENVTWKSSAAVCKEPGTAKCGEIFLQCSEDYLSTLCKEEPAVGGDHPLKNMEDKGIFDSGCSGHVTGNKDHLDDFEECKGGYVTFGGSKGYITGDTLSMLGKFDEKCDEGFLVGYSLNSKAFRVLQKCLTVQVHYQNVYEEEDEAEKLIVVPTALKHTAAKVGPRMSSTNSKVEKCLTELQNLKTQEKAAYSTGISEDTPEILAFRKELDELAQKHLREVPKNKATSTNSVNSGSGQDNSQPDNQDDSDMPELTIFNTHQKGIFDEASYDDEGMVQDFNNLPTEVAVSPIPTLRIHNIHPQSQILGDPNSSVQTRSRVQKHSGAHALFRLQQVWILVDLPHGAKVIGTKWVYRNKRDERGVVVRNKARLVAQSQTGRGVWTMIRVFAIVSRIDAISVKTAITPMETKVALTKDEDAVDVDVTPKTSHLNAVKRIFKYLKGKPNLGLWYPRESPLDLEAFSDSDYGGSNLDRKYTTGGCQFLGQRLIS
ncbi:putative ribonuclease H-like domain-containing protein [Tanacetum coccineum]